MGEEEIVEIEGKIYKRVQIEESAEDYLMDEEGKIYDMELKMVGEAGGDSDDDEWYWYETLSPTIYSYTITYLLI